MLRQVEGYLLDDVADADATAQMRGSRQGILVVNPQQVQVHVQKQGSGILSVDLEFLHGLDVTAVDVK